MKLGRLDGWWNRRVPIAQICLIVGVLLAGLYVWSAYGDLISSIVWGVRHKRTVSFRGQALRVPWFWREEVWTNYNQFELTRSNSGLAFNPTVTVRYENSEPENAQGEVDGIRKLYARISQVPSSFYGDYEGDNFSKTHYVCLEEQSKLTPVTFVTCFSRDGRWMVRMIGLRQILPDFEMILRGVASMGNPTK